MKLVEEIEKVEVQKQLQKIVSEFSRLSFLVLVHNISLIQFFCTERKTNTNRAEQILLSSESQNPTNNRVPKVLFPQSIDVSNETDYISIGLIFGFLICLMLLPSSVGLNGALPPYGRGRGRSESSLGMQAFGRGSAVVMIPPGIL